MFSGFAVKLAYALDIGLEFDLMKQDTNETDKEEEVRIEFCINCLALMWNQC